MEKRCYGCMKLKKQSPICEHCGFNEIVQNLPHQLPLGTILRDQYLVGKVLGQGGFGITYMGWDLSLETPVAIKEYYPNGIVTREATQSVVATGGGTMEEIFRQNRERFLREARIQAKLSNVPGIVRVHNLFAENNTAYIIMEFVEGVDLRRYIGLRGACLSVEETFRFLTPVMEALEKVHAAGLVHRDISPDNIMIQTDGTAKLLDFGAARDVGQADVNHIPSQSTEAILKHGFAPLEQYRRRGNLGPWTDVYALCATMYYCMTGTVPSDAPERVMGDDNVNWTSVPGLTEQQIEILEQGMAMMPDKRIASVAELLAGLQGRVNPVKPISTTPVQTPAISVEPVKQPVTPVQPSYMAEKRGAYPAYTLPLEESTVTIPRKIPISSMPPVEEEKPKPVENLTKPNKYVGLMIAVILVIVLAVGLLSKSSQEKWQSTPEQQENVAETECTQPVIPAPNTGVLRSDSELNTIFGSGIERKNIGAITFFSTLQNAPSDAWDASEAEDCSVLVWIDSSTRYHTLCIAAEGGVKAPENCRRLFAEYVNLKSIDFNGSFDTSGAVNMVNMFYACQSLETLDLSEFNTANATDMGGMFASCNILMNLDLHTFDTSRVTDMGGMFMGMNAIEKLDVDNFDTSQVTNMFAMFNGCYNLKDLNANDFDTSSVTNMSEMFDGCEKNLNTLDISRWDLSNVTEYDYFMNDNGRIKGRSWKSYFK